ncbi:MAG: hypothetical protein PVF34_01925, partial [Gammaproteobacteria bacterium]
HDGGHEINDTAAVIIRFDHYLSCIRAAPLTNGSIKILLTHFTRDVAAIKGLFIVYRESMVSISIYTKKRCTMMRYHEK